VKRIANLFSKCLGPLKSILEEWQAKCEAAAEPTDSPTAQSTAESFGSMDEDSGGFPLLVDGPGGVSETWRSAAQAVQIHRIAMAVDEYDSAVAALEAAGDSPSLEVKQRFKRADDGVIACDNDFGQEGFFTQPRGATNHSDADCEGEENPFVQIARALQQFDAATTRTAKANARAEVKRIAVLSSECLGPLKSMLDEWQALDDPDTDPEGILDLPPNDAMQDTAMDAKDVANAGDTDDEDADIWMTGEATHFRAPEPSTRGLVSSCEREELPGRAEPWLPPVSALEDDLVVTQDDVVIKAADDEEYCKVYGLSVTCGDLKTCMGQKWLDAQILNAFFRLLERDNLPHLRLGSRKVQCLPTWWYASVCQRRDVTRWVRRSPHRVLGSDGKWRPSPFGADVVIIPVHLSVHWAVGVAHMSEKVIEYADSVGGADRNFGRRILTQFERTAAQGMVPFNREEWKVRVLIDRNTPQQDNTFDCGAIAGWVGAAAAFGIATESDDAEIPFSMKSAPEIRQYIRAAVYSHKASPGDTQD
jgi:hypothetical protein